MCGSVSLRLCARAFLSPSRSVSLFVCVREKERRRDGWRERGKEKVIVVHAYAVPLSKSAYPAKTEPDTTSCMACDPPSRYRKKVYISKGEINVVYHVCNITIRVLVLL